MITTSPKASYSEHEAASLLGISIEQLRSTVKDHIVKGEDVPGGAVSTFQPSDLLILRILSRMTPKSEAA